MLKAFKFTLLLFFSIHNVKYSLIITFYCKQQQSTKFL